MSRSAVVHRPGLAVDGRHADHLGPICDADGLVAEAHTQHRDRWTQAPHQLHADPRLLRPRRAGRDDDRVRVERLDLVDGHRVVARDRDIGADSAQQLHDVVGERVVVVEQEDPHASGPPMAASIEAAFDATSAASRSGTESATIPAPAWTVAIPSRMRADLMVMAHSTSVGEK